MKSKKYVLLGLLLVVLAVIAFVVVPWKEKPPLMTFEEVAENYGEFYSLVYDRSDVTEGSFTLFPAVGDRFRVVVDSFQDVFLKAETITKKTRSQNGQLLEIETGQAYRLDLGYVLAGVIVPIRTGGWKGERELPTAISFETGPSAYRIDAKLFQELKGLGQGSHILELKIVSLLDLDTFEPYYSDVSSEAQVIVSIERIDGIKIKTRN